jgi:hypothetical protein
MIQCFAEFLGGHILMHTEMDMCNDMGHGRLGYVIDIHRFDKEYVDHQFYLDIGVFPGSYQPTGKPQPPPARLTVNGEYTKPTPPKPPPDRIYRQGFWYFISQIFGRKP